MWTLIAVFPLDQQEGSRDLESLSDILLDFFIGQVVSTTIVLNGHELNTVACAIVPD